MAKLAVCQAQFPVLDLLCVCCQYTSLATRFNTCDTDRTCFTVCGTSLYRGNVNKQPKLSTSHLACLKQRFFFFFHHRIHSPTKARRAIVYYLQGSFVLYIIVDATYTLYLYTYAFFFCRVASRSTSMKSPRTRLLSEAFVVLSVASTVMTS